MFNTSISNFILLVPLFLMILGIILMVFWIKKQEFISLFWFAIATFLNGSAIFLQSLISSEHLNIWFPLLGLMYLLTYITLTQAILLHFSTYVSWRFCLFILISTETGLLYYSLFYDDLILRMVILAFSTTLVLSHKLSFVLKTSANHLIDRFLKVVFILTCLIFLGRTILLLHSMLSHSVHLIDFYSVSHWFLNQLFILVLTMIFATLLISSNIRNTFNIHQLELEKTKLQERIQLSHDLHDILGSSLVRSMGIISQSKDQLDNQQFLSMLKLFRDDLRQVIDSGSSTGADIPKTPILWGAPIRHRFSQIFDELGIHAEWKFANTWSFPVTPLECLTLQRVAEEALTNIIKHSKATHTVIRLSFPSTQQLILEIEDNGNGFDYELLKQTNLSVGLRSMQTRLGKIQATLNIESQAGKTLIQVTKLFRDQA